MSFGFNQGNPLRNLMEEGTRDDAGTSQMELEAVRDDAGTSQMELEDAENIIEETVRDDSMTQRIGLEGGATRMEGVRDDSTTQQIGLEGGATRMEGVRDDCMKPQIGMEFLSQDHAYEFYNRYALKTGFGVRRASTSSSRSDKSKVLSRVFLCCKEGAPNLTVKDGATEDVHNRQERVRCNAKMKILLTSSNTWKVSKFVEQHDNHELTTPTKTPKYRSHKQLHRRTAVKKLMTHLHSKGIRNSEIAKVVTALEVGPDDIVTPQNDIVTPQQVQLIKLMHHPKCLLAKLVLRQHLPSET